MAREELVMLVTTDIFTPYKKDEVFAVNKETAERLLKPSMERTDFGPRYPKVKVRLFDKDRDQELLLDNGYLTEEAHKELLQKIRPDLYDAEYTDDESVDEDEKPADDTTELAAVTSAPTRRRRNSR
jgi:hypothetical protein